MPHLCRSAGLTGYGDLVRSLGLDPLRLAREAGVPAAALTDPDQKIPSSALGWMFETAARRSGVEDLGVRLAEKRRLSNIGAVGLVAREQPILRKALEVMAQYQWIQNDAVSLHIEETKEIGVVRLDFAAPGQRASRQGIELSVGVLCQNIRALLTDRWRPQAVCFVHSSPKSLSTHRRVFGVTPLFEQDFNGIVLNLPDLDAPITAADPDMARHIERYVQQLAVGRAKSIEDEVSELILLLLPTGSCTAVQVAKHLGVDRRTLHRKLDKERKGFSQLLDEKRAELASSLISDSSRSLGEIAEHLGFSCASAFSHWFRRHYGCSPRAFRQTRTRRPEEKSKNTRP